MGLKNFNVEFGFFVLFFINNFHFDRKNMDQFYYTCWLVDRLFETLIIKLFDVCVSFENVIVHFIMLIAALLRIIFR